jgi:trigger factor
MHVTKEKLSPTSFKLVLVADSKLLGGVKQKVLKHLGEHVKLQGFRAGKAPLELVEKNVDQDVLQREFLEEAINELYVQGVEQEKLRPVAQPQVSVTKFVPFTTLEVSAEVEAIGDIKLADYTKVKLAPTKVSVTEKDVDDVIHNLQLRAAEKVEVKRAAKDGDEILIDFAGVDAKTKEPIAGADGTDYPLLLGSKTFIPGFEDNVVGIKPGEQKDFTITFPKDYGVSTLQNRKITFTVTAQKVNEIKEPKMDDAFAASIGPFKTVADLRADIKRQLEAEKQAEADREYDNRLLEAIAEKSHIDIPQSLIEQEIDRIEEQEKQNTVYRGQTWQEHLDAEGVTAEEHRERNRKGAELRVKAGLILGEVADRENIQVSPQELEMRLMLLKGQYTDAAMQAELDKPENVRDIGNRLITEKTLDKLKSFAQSK